MQATTLDIIKRYYDSYNKRDMTAFLNLLDENVIHDINQGGKEIGKKAFATYMKDAIQSSNEVVKNLVIMMTEDGARAAAEFMVEGNYVATYADFPKATGQHYKLDCGAFFEVKNGKITRVTVYYNFNDWLKQITE